MRFFPTIFFKKKIHTRNGIAEKLFNRSALQVALFHFKLMNDFESEKNGLQTNLILNMIFSIHWHHESEKPEIKPLHKDYTQTL